MSEAPILVVVASKNPVKLAATKEAFARVFPTATFQYETLSVPSGVPDQPFSDRETLQGALNRARSAKELQPRADYWIGLEGGVDDWEGTLLQSFAWMAIVNREGKEGKARTSAYFLPQETAKLVRGGMELGHADDLLYGKTNSKHQGGSVGLLTEDVVTRQSYYIEAIVLALIPFNHPDKTFR
ncbi:hypothetical protein VHEMI06423 [[Torrubiella] hemipterigena]|uniref:inosine/xanthosine triphosphatase n=1 Tax=[Torrubiella] hemipterigena TaxID=1531966 RepID=A0A0A1TJ45_9HYPO|nr:hypothetical protein VHEMI06423 [[Torrubiella] hemipterigena]